MKKSKLLIFLLAAVTSVTVASGLTLTACAGGDPDTNQTEEHQHSWASSWSSDETGHWHACNDSTCNEKGSFAAHDQGSWVIVTPATETTTGLRELRCTVCGYVLDSEVIPVTGGGDVAEKYTVTFDTNGGSAIASAEVDEGGKVTRPTDPTYDGYVFDGWYADEDLTTPFDFENTTVTSDITIYAKWTEKSVTPPATQYTVTFNTNGGSAIDPVKVDEGGKVTKPTDPTNTNGENIVFGGWYSDVLLTTPFDFENTTITADTTLYAKWQQNITTAVDFMDLAEANGNTSGNQSFPTEGLEYLGIFEFTGGRTEPTNNCVNTQGNAIVITLTGTTNSITIYGRGASSSNASAALYDSQNQLVTGSETGTLANNQYFGAPADNPSAGTPIVISNLPAGTYTFDGSGSLRIYTLAVTQLLDLGTPTGIAANGVSAPGTDILVGQEYNPNGVTAQITYDNGTTQTKAISVDDIDVSEVNEAQAGVYNVSFSYTENGQTVSGSYQVNVYAIDSITIGDYLQSGEVTTNLKKVYLDDEALSVEGLTVIASAKTGTGADAKTDEFVVPASYYAAQKNPEGTACEITVGSEYLLDTAKAATASYTIYGIQAADVLAAVEDGVLNVTVDASAAVSATSYKTLTDALCAIKGAEVPDYVIKQITVADGEYKEKVYVDVPNVHLKAENIVENSAIGTGEDKNTNVVFWYDALSGIGDPAGNAHGTNGSASFTIGETAVGFRAEGITFKNYYNTNELYEASRLITGDTQAVALYVGAEQAAFYNCKMTSYHDTLYAISGSHYFENCWIEGRTDFIFGNSAKSYYKNCNIWVIGADSATNGGYVCATQNKDLTGAFVFDGCDFDGDEHVVDGTAALGRPWGADMKMVVMNSTISGKFSTKQHTAGTAQGERYVQMSGNDPVPANYIEYNNTGAGALIYGTAPADNPVGVYLDDAAVAEYAITTCTLATTADAVAAYQLDAFYTDWDPTVKDLVTVTVMSNDGLTEYGTMAVFSGSSVTADDLGVLLPEDAVAVGHMIVGYASSASSQEPAELGAVSANTTYYLITEEVQSGTAVPGLYNVSNLTGYTDEQTIATGTPINDDVNLTLTATVDVKYDSSLASKQPTIPGQSGIVTAGFKTASDTDAGATTGSYVFTAKCDMKLTVYMVHTNNSFNSDRPATFSYTLSGGQAQTQTTAGRDTMVVITVDIVAGQTLTVNAVNNHASSGSRLWLFGYNVEAPAQA